MTQNEVLHQNLLADHAEALIAGTLDLDALLEQYGLQKADPHVLKLMALAEHLYGTMPTFEPSPEFVQELYEKLVGIHHLPMMEWLRNLQLDRISIKQLQLDLQAWGLPPLSIDRFRHMPRHMQLAAGITLAGVVWMASKTRREALWSLIYSNQTEPLEENNNTELSA